MNGYLFALIPVMVAACPDTAYAADQAAVSPPAAAEPALTGGAREPMEINYRKPMRMDEPMPTGMAKPGMKKGDVKKSAEKKEPMMEEMMRQEMK